MSNEDQNQTIQAQLQCYQGRSALFARPGFLIRRLHQIHTWLFVEATRQYGVTPVQFSVLTILASLGEMDQNTLALEIGLERTSVAEVLPRLEAREWVERRQSTADRRVKLVKVTRKGRALVKRMELAVQRAHDRTIEPIPPQERDLFLLQLSRLVEAHNDASVVPLRIR